MGLAQITKQDPVRSNIITPFFSLDLCQSHTGYFRHCKYGSRHHIIVHFHPSIHGVFSGNQSLFGGHMGKHYLGRSKYVSNRINTRDICLHSFISKDPPFFVRLNPDRLHANMGGIGLASYADQYLVRLECQGSQIFFIQFLAKMRRTDGYTGFSPIFFNSLNGPVDHKIDLALFHLALDDLGAILINRWNGKQTVHRLYYGHL